MSKVVLDASAVLAVLNGEPGGDRVLAQLDHSIISTVNYAEVVSKLSRAGGDVSPILTDLQNLLRDIRPFEAEQALAVGLLEPHTRETNLSLGDRACLVLGKHLGVPVLTADQAWSNFDIGVKIELIRGLPS